MVEKVVYYANGKAPAYRMWLRRDDLHRVGKPARVWYFTNGVIRSEEYFRNNLPHNAKGPAVIDYKRDGSVKKEYYALDGEWLDIVDWAQHCSATMDKRVAIKLEHK